MRRIHSRRVRRDAAKYRSGALELTKEQQAALAALPAYSSDMIVSDPDRQLLTSQFDAYLAASDSDKPKKEAEMVQALAEVAKRSLEPTLAATDDYIAKIKAILTPDQVTKLTQPRTAASTRPASTPTTGAAKPLPAR